MEHNNPKISVIVPCCNYSRYLPACLNSILSQTYDDFEVIVIDDASQDESFAVAQEYERYDSRIKTFRNKVNEGLIAVRNRGLALAKGDYVAILDADDLWYPSFLEKAMSLLESDRNIGVVISSWDLIDEQGNKRGVFRVSKATTIEDNPKKLLLLEGHCPSACVWRKDKAIEVGGFDSRFPHSGDRHFIWKLGAVSKVAFINEVLAGYRRHPGQMSARRGSDPQKALEESLSMREEFFSSFSLNLELQQLRRSLIAHAYLHHAKLALVKKERGLARKLCIKALVTDPKSFITNSQFVITSLLILAGPHIYNAARLTKAFLVRRTRLTSKAESPSSSQRLRVLFTAPRFHTNQHYPVKALLDAGHEVAFLALRRGRTEEYSALTPKVFGHSRLFAAVARLLKRGNSERFILRFAFPPILQFWREVKNLKPSVVIVRDPNTAYGLLSILAAKAARARLIFYTQGPKYRGMGAFERVVRSLFPAIIGAEWITPVLGNPGPGASTLSRVHYMPFVMAPGTPPEKKEWFRGGVINIMTVGKFQPRKNHTLLLRAIKELAREFQVRLTIIGECTTRAHHDELKRVQACMEALKLEGLVEIKVNLPFSKVQELYSVHDLFVLPSSNEPAAVSILEAMAHGLPVICSDSNGTKCYIEEGQNGFVFRSNDLQDLIAKMKSILEDRARLIDMGRRSYQLVLECHLPERYVEVLTQIVKNRGHVQWKS